MSSSKIIPFPKPPAAEPNGESGEMNVAMPIARPTVTFRSPFLLPGMDVPQRAGTYEIRETRHAIDVSWGAYHISRSIVLVDGGTTEVLDVALADLDAALARDLATAD